MGNAALIAKAAAVLATNEDARKSVGWIVAAILAPLILVVAVICVLGSGAADHNISAAQRCFGTGEIPANVPEEYRVCIEQMREWFTELDDSISALQENMEEGNSLDPIRVKAIFYTLYFGGEGPNIPAFLDCFVSGGSPETNTAPVPAANLDTVYENIAGLLGTEIPDELKSNAESVYSLIKNGYPSTGDGGDSFEGADTPFVGADGFCSPVGENWRNIVTSEFGGRIDPINGKQDGHNGMDLAVPTGTPIRAAMGGTVTTATYHSSYGYYVMVDHGNGLTTLYAHNSRLMVHVGQTVQAGDEVSLSGATGRVTGPHLHFEVRVNGQRTNPRYYLP